MKAEMDIETEDVLKRLKFFIGERYRYAGQLSGRQKKNEWEISRIG